MKLFDSRNARFVSEKRCEDGRLCEYLVGYPSTDVGSFGPFREWAFELVGGRARKTAKGRIASLPPGNARVGRDRRGRASDQIVEYLEPADRAGLKAQQ